MFYSVRQLRDMITFPSKDKREIVAVYQNNVLQYNIARKTSTTLLKDISFSPTTVTSDYGYLAVGGQRSQVIIRQLNSNWYMNNDFSGLFNLLGSRKLQLVVP